MNIPLRVLMVEDSELDGMLVLRELRRSGRLIEFERVEDADSFRAALERSWNLVTCDWSMPRFSAPAALAILREKELDLPFIIVSGTIGEANAVEAMRAGAHDYVLKHQLARLGPAVDRELGDHAARSARRQAEAALRASEQRCRQIIETANEGVWITDAQQRTTFVNVQMALMLGYAGPAEMIGRPMTDFMDATEAAAASARLAERRSGHGSQTAVRLCRRDGGELWTLLAEAPIVGATEACEGTVTMVMDITERRNAMEAQQLLFMANPVPIYVFATGSLRFLAVNDAALALYGYSREEFLAMRLPDLMLPETVPAAGDLGRPSMDADWANAVTHRRKNGTLRRVEVSARLLTFEGQPCRLAAIIDVTERERLGEQLRQAQKMEAVGRLAGGVAHDFNNVLSVILSLGDLLLSDLPQGQPMREDIEEICRSGRRAADLTRQLLMFSRKNVLEPKVLNLNDVLAQIDKLLQRIVGEDIELVARPGTDIGLVRADPGGLEQVIMNLVVNARDAMPTGGKLTLETANVTLDDEYARLHLGVAPGPHVMFAVTDTGCGMDKELQSRIFEPFFTTKDVGKGTGLGLSTVFGICQQARGSIWVYSEVGRGSTFKVYLPRVDQVPVSQSSSLPQSIAEGRETVLLVEDEDPVRAVARRILRRSGYRVLEARAAEEALRIATEYEGTIHLLLTDVVMPLTGGPSLALEMSRVREGIRVLYMSGYTDDSVVRHGVLTKDMPFLQKPFTRRTLTKKVREILDSPSADARSQSK